MDVDKDVEEEQPAAPGGATIAIYDIYCKRNLNILN